MFDRLGFADPGGDPEGQPDDQRADESQDQPAVAHAAEPAGSPMNSQLASTPSPGKPGMRVRLPLTRYDGGMAVQRRRGEAVNAV